MPYRLTLTDGFGVDELRAFSERCVVPFRKAELQSNKADMATCDIFLTGLTRLVIEHLTDDTLTAPTTLVRLKREYCAGRLSVAGTKNLTRLKVASDDSTVTACPRLRELNWYGVTLFEALVPVRDVTTLSAMTVSVRDINPAFVFPTGRTGCRTFRGGLAR